MKSAKNHMITEEIKEVADKERIDVNKLVKRIKKGTVIITRNLVRENVKPIGIGEGLDIKVNANIGTSADVCDIGKEIEKARIAARFGADTVMDLSTGDNIKETREAVLNSIDIPIGTVPIYEAAIKAIDNNKAIVEMSEDEMFNIIKEHADSGVDFMTIHCGVTRGIVENLKDHPRKLGMVSRGGTFLAAWIIHNEKENPYYKNFDYLLELASEYDFSISLGDGLRPGTIFDSSDWAQFQELLEISRLVKKAREKNIQVMVEGPGHLKLDQIDYNMKIQKSVCEGAPFYVLGPICTEIAPGYDHIVCAIGGAIAGMSGADFLCYVTPSEHLGLPDIEDVKQGVIATKIAAHSANIVRRGPKASNWDLEMAKARAKLDWKKQFELALDSERAESVYSRAKLKGELEDEIQPCTMCGKYCALKILQKYIGKPVFFD
ncbi:MAG: phosphomethylpyrimidine synthase ThiC [Candidatus Lokiarchaeota archaeon]|nr:phosphomethylpyrimidine synthase ThiC [Candidatus Lokiarchaeota archaeon]